jgi:hypothetical protein
MYTSLNVIDAVGESGTMTLKNFKIVRNQITGQVDWSGVLYSFNAVFDPSKQSQGLYTNDNGTFVSYGPTAKIVLRSPKGNRVFDLTLERDP